MFSGQAYLDDIVFTFRKQKESAERAFRQVEDVDFFRKPGEHSNSIALIIKHVGGNLASRWTDFLTTDGDKPWRNRDGEFNLVAEDTRSALIDAWEAGWIALFQTLGSLQEADLTRRVTIRREEHTVFQAIHRSLTHTAYHVGQIVFLAKQWKDAQWKTLSVPRGQSEQVNAKMLQKQKNSA